MAANFLNSVLILNQILNAGNAITAFSLVLYSLTFNVRDRTARILSLLLGCVAIVYSGDVLAGTAQTSGEIELWLRLEWVGISFVPALYLHISDALLAATGRPSRGRRRLLNRLSYLTSGAMLALVGLTDLLVAGVVPTEQSGYLAPGPLFPLFAAYFLFSLAITWMNLWRSYRRCLTTVSRRRMLYLMAGSLAPALGTFPVLTVTGDVLAQFTIAFWSGLALINVLVAGQMVLMAYSLAYFGVSYPDRVVKSRLFQWLLRGPVVASTVLAVTVVINRLSLLLGLENSRAIPLSMVATLLLLQFFITISRPTIERLLFYGQDRGDIARLHLLEERLLTSGDLQQFLEAILNATCDVTMADSAFIAVIGSEGLELEVAVGPDDPLRGSQQLPAMLTSGETHELQGIGTAAKWDRFWLLSLKSDQTDEPVGMLGLDYAGPISEWGSEVIEALRLICQRASVALTNRKLQKEIFSTVDRLVPAVEEIQRIRAAASYAGADVLAATQGVHSDSDLYTFVRQALGHYWGGPRLMDSPLMRLRIVREAMLQNEGKPVNALRAILRRAIDRVRPEGERRFTAEWMLYNILELKFLEGRKVRDVALRLAMSEADLYRKQKVAIEAVARAVAEMEREAMNDGN
jgi:hypothetical protein